MIDSNRYMTLGTVDESGPPCVSPVWYVPAGYREFFSVSSPDAKHSRNLAVRPQARGARGRNPVVVRALNRVPDQCWVCGRAGEAPAAVANRD